MARKRKNEKSLKQQLSFIEYLEGKDIEKGLLQSVINMTTHENLLISVCFKNTIIEKIIDEFNKNTDIPDEIPAMCFLTVWSGFLNVKGVKGIINLSNGQIEIETDIWNILLAESGSGKTYTLKTIKQLNSNLSAAEIPSSSVSSASFIQVLASQSKGYFVRDEWAEYLYAIKSQTHMKEMKDYFLRAYNNEKLIRKTKKETIETEEIVMSILATTVFESLLQKLEVIDLIDGFAQRFCYIIAQKDPNRNVFTHLIYKDNIKKYKEEVDQIINNIQNRYYFDDNFEEFCKRNLKEIFKNFNIENSYIRRIAFRLLKYSIILQTLIDPKETTISSHAIEKAILLCYRHITDLKKILTHFGYSELEKKIQAIERLKEKLGRMPTKREIITYIWNIKTVKEAEILLSLIQQEPPPQVC